MKLKQNLYQFMVNLLLWEKYWKDFFSYAFESTISYIESLKDDSQYVHIKFYSKSTVET